MEKAEEIADAIEHIAQREAELSRYSDKLRESVQKVFNLFGDPEVCALCGTQKGYHGLFRFFNGQTEIYTDDVSNLLAAGTHRMLTEQEKHGRTGWMDKDGKILVDQSKDHVFKPKIRLSLRLNGRIYTTDAEEGSTSFIASRRGALVLVESWGDEEVYRPEEEYQPEQVSRAELKQIVKERRITEFLKTYIAELDAQAAEYGSVSEIAEKLASAV